MFSWFGHQSRFVLPAKVECITGHFPAVSSVFASISLSKRSFAFSRSVYNDHQCFESDPGRRKNRRNDESWSRERVPSIGNIAQPAIGIYDPRQQVIYRPWRRRDICSFTVVSRCTYNQFVGILTNAVLTGNLARCHGIRRRCIRGLFCHAADGLSIKRNYRRP